MTMVISTVQVSIGRVHLVLLAVLCSAVTANVVVRQHHAVGMEVVLLNRRRHH